MSAMGAAALGGSICLNNAGEALGWLNPNAISILFYSCRYKLAEASHKAESTKYQHVTMSKTWLLRIPNRKVHGAGQSELGLS